MRRLNRREFLGAGSMLAAAVPQRRGKNAPALDRRLPDVAVVGAGVFGASTAYFLRRRGFNVRLLDAWGVAHPRATSSGETRIIRFSYGPQPLYTRWAWEALSDWKQWQKEWGAELFHPTGVIWLASEENDYFASSMKSLAGLKIPAEHLTLEEVLRRYPQFAALDTRVALFEAEAGVLSARRGCQALVRAFERLGGRFELAVVEPPAGPGAKLPALRTAAGEKISAGVFVFACGPWLVELFPALVGKKIEVSKQEVFFFGPPPGRADFRPPRFPTWIDMGSGLGGFPFYGIPALDERGLKIASDRTGPPFDPTHGDRVASPESLAEVRRYMAARFPVLKDAPLSETRVCQYERTADSHLILDRHPEWENVWIAGGGSGHGFKLGPTVGRFLAARIADGNRRLIPTELRLS